MKNWNFFSSPLFSLKEVMIAKCLSFFFSSSWIKLIISARVHVLIDLDHRCSEWERDPGSALGCPFIAVMSEKGVFFVFNVKSGNLTIKVVNWIRKELKFTNSQFKECYRILVGYADVVKNVQSFSLVFSEYTVIRGAVSLKSDSTSDSMSRVLRDLERYFFLNNDGNKMSTANA